MGNAGHFFQNFMFQRIRTMDWISQNWQTIALIVTSTIALASHMAALTPSKNDDNAVGWAKKLWDFIAGNYWNAKNMSN